MTPDAGEATADAQADTTSTDLARVERAAPDPATRAARRQTLTAKAVDMWASTLTSPATQRSYRHAVLNLLATQEAITAATVVAWRDQQLKAGLSHATIRQRMAAVRAFTAWAEQTGRLALGHTAELATVQAPASSGRHRPMFVGAEQLRLLDAAAGAAWPDDPLHTAQARVILRVLGGCGLRVSELAQARADAMRPSRPMVADRSVLAGRPVVAWQLNVVDGKGGHNRTVPLPPSARRAIQTLHRQLPEAPRMLVPALSRHRPARALTRGVAVRTIQATLRHLAEHANGAARAARRDPAEREDEADVVPLSCAHPHALRHGFALRYLAQEDAKLAGLSRLLGHTSMATTALYLAAHQADREPAPTDPWAS